MESNVLRYFWVTFLKKLYIFFLNYNVMHYFTSYLKQVI